MFQPDDIIDAGDVTTANIRLRDCIYYATPMPYSAPTHGTSIVELIDD